MRTLRHFAIVCVAPTTMALFSFRKTVPLMIANAREDKPLLSMAMAAGTRRLFVEDYCRAIALALEKPSRVPPTTFRPACPNLT